MLPETLLNQRLILVTGKGGVGKSTLSGFLSLELSKASQKVLLVELNSLNAIPKLFQKKAPTEQKITKLTDNIDHINLDPEKCFEEYIIKQIKFSALYKTFLNNKLVRHFLNAVPGLNEVLMLGKIYEFWRTDAKKKTNYDALIIDAPASGHGLSTFQVPQVLTKAVKIGPLHNHGKDIITMLNDKQTALTLITLAEEMPVTECIEFREKLAQETQIPLGPVILNSLKQKPLPLNAKYTPKSDTEQTLLDYHQLGQKRFEVQEKHKARLKKATKKGELFGMPFVHDIHLDADNSDLKLEAL